MNEYLYRIQPVRPAMLTQGPNQAEQEATAEHFYYLTSLLERGILIMAGRTQNDDYSSFGIVVFRAASDEEARDIVESDPAVQKRVMRAELFPYRIALMENPER